MENDLIQEMTATFEGHAITDHFVDANKMVELRKGGLNKMDDIGKVERRLASSEKKSLLNPDRLKEDE